jgi:hypothetical protein
VEPFLGITTIIRNHFVNNQGQIHGKYASYQRSHMNDKAHEGIKVHEIKKRDGDLM